MIGFTFQPESKLCKVGNKGTRTKQGINMMKMS